MLTMMVVLTGGIEAWKSAQGAIKAGPTRWDLAVRATGGEEALAMIAAGATRIGASKGIAIIGAGEASESGY